MLKPLHRPICHSYSGLYAEQDLTEQHLRTMDVKLMTLVTALMVALYAPPLQGMELYPCFLFFFVGKSFARPSEIIYYKGTECETTRINHTIIKLKIIKCIPVPLNCTY